MLLLLSRPLRCLRLTLSAAYRQKFQRSLLSANTPDLLLLNGHYRSKPPLMCFLQLCRHWLHQSQSPSLQYLRLLPPSKRKMWLLSNYPKREQTFRLHTRCLLWSSAHRRLLLPAFSHVSLVATVPMRKTLSPVFLLCLAAHQFLMLLSLRCTALLPQRMTCASRRLVFALP